MNAAPSAPPRPARPALRWTLMTLALLLLILTPFLLFETQISAWTHDVLEGLRDQPTLGGGLIVALLAGDVVLPVPSSVVSAFAGAAFGWKMAATVIWVGMTLGCVGGYLLGRSAGRGVALRVVGAGEMDRARRLFENVGPAALIVTRAVPVLAEAGTLAAGAAHMPFVPFIASTALANVGVALAYAGVGAFAASSGSFLAAFIGLATIPALAWAGWRAYVSRRSASRPSQ